MRLCPTQVRGIRVAVVNDGGVESTESNPCGDKPSFCSADPIQAQRCPKGSLFVGA